LEVQMFGCLANIPRDKLKHGSNVFFTTTLTVNFTTFLHIFPTEFNRNSGEKIPARKHEHSAG
jgi:hypothetical protein